MEKQKFTIKTKNIKSKDHLIRIVLHNNCDRKDKGSFVLDVLKKHGLPNGSYNEVKGRKSLADKLLTLSVKYSWIDVFDYMIENYSAVKDYLKANYLPIMAARNNNVVMFDKLLKVSNIDVDTKNMAFRVAAKSNSIDIVKRILQFEDVDINDGTGDALKEACRLGRVEIVELLLNDERIDITVSNMQPYRMAQKYLEKKKKELGRITNLKRIEHKKEQINDYTKIINLLEGKIKSNLSFYLSKLGN